MAERKKKPKGKAQARPKAAADSRKVGKSPQKPGRKPGTPASNKGKARTPGSGRKAGTPNKRTLELRDALEAAGLTTDTHPVVMMFKVYTGEITMPACVAVDAETGARTFMDMPLEPALRVQCMKEVAQYLEPKRKAVDKDGDETDRMEVTLVDSTSYREWLDHPKNRANRGMNKGKA